DLDGLRGRIELIVPGDNTALVRIFVAGRKDHGKFDLLRSLLKAFVQTAPLKIHGYRSLANGSNRVDLNDRGEVALVSRFLGDVGAFVDERPADEPGDRRMQLHLLQCEFREPDIGARLIYLRSREVPLRLRLPQLHLRGYFSCAQ